MKSRKIIPQRFWIAEGPALAPLLLAARALPPGTGVIFRCYAERDRTAWARALADLCRRRRLTLLVAGDAALARRVKAAGLHLPEGLAMRPRIRPKLLTVAAHGRRALARAKAIGADAVLLSPVHATTSHPGAATLGPHRFACLARAAGVPVIALGGLKRGQDMRMFGAKGVAGITMFG